MKTSIISLLWISLFQNSNKGIYCLLYEARNNVMYISAQEQKFKQAIRDINPQMCLAQIVTLGSEGI